MDDSWQKLMGLDCGSAEGPSSPVFHKKKWVVFPRSLKRSGSGTLLTKCPEKKPKNKTKKDSDTSLQISDQNSAMPPEDETQRNLNADEDDRLLIYTTPTKNCKQKRKTIDLLSCSFRSEGNVFKKSKLDDKEQSGLSKDPLDIKREPNLDESGSETFMPTSVTVSSPQSNKGDHSQKSITSKPQRKLLYSFNEKSASSVKTKTITVNDILKSVIMIDDADIHSSPKKHRQTDFEVGSNDFQTVTSLAKGCTKVDNNLVLSPSVSDLQNCNDSFGNCLFTEIENECIKTKEVCLNSSFQKIPMISDDPASPVDANPMDETFSNYRFTEIEEDYNRLNHKGLEENDQESYTIKAAVAKSGSSYKNSQNNVGRNNCSLLKNKNDYPSSEPDCLESGVFKKNVEDEAHHSVNNERDKILLQENGLEDSSGDEKDIFNSSILYPKSISKLETATDKELFLSSSKDCFNDLDAISTEQFRNNHLENDHHEANVSLTEDELNQSIDNPEKDMLNKSASKLNVTLTDIMQRLFEKSFCNKSKSDFKKQSLDKPITSNGNSSFNGLAQEITNEEETKDDEMRNKTLGNISSSEYIPEPSGILGPNEPAFLTQEYLENVKPESSVDTSVLFYQQSFDYMISAEVKSRLSGNNCALPPVKPEHLLSDRSLSSEVLADCDGRLPDDSFIDINKDADFNQSDACDLNDSVNVIPNATKSSTNIDYFNDSSEIKFSQYEHTPHNSNINVSPKVLMGTKDFTECNNIEILSNTVCSKINKLPIQTPCNAGIFSLNSDLISQGCLQQFNNSFQFESDNLDSQKRETNLNKSRIEENNVSSMNSHRSPILPMNNKNINISEECSRKDKLTFNDFLNDTILITQSDNPSAYDRVCYEGKEKSANLLNPLSENKFVNTNEGNGCLSKTKTNSNLSKLPHSLNLVVENPSDGNVNNDILETFHSDLHVSSQKQSSSVTHQKSDANSSLGKSAKVSEELLKKSKSISDNLVVTSQDNILSSNVHIDRLNSDRESKTVPNTETDLTFKSPFLRPNKVSSPMFSSAGGNKIQVSSNALAKVKSMFKDLLESDSADNIEDKTGISQVHKTFLTPRTSKADNFKFPGASDKSFDISESHLIRSKNTENTTYINKEPKSLPKSSEVEHFMISSISGKKTTIPEDAIVKVKSKFNDLFDDSITEVGSIEINRGPDESGSGFGNNDKIFFSSASGNKIKVSDEALAKVRTKFSEVMECHEVTITKNKTETNVDQASKKHFPSTSKNTNFLFSSASGKEVKVSDDTVAEVKAKYNDINIMDNYEPEVKVDRTEIDIGQASKSSVPSKNDNFLFSSASGENDKVSDDALAKVKSKYMEIMEYHETEAMKNKFETDMNLTPKITLPASGKIGNFMFSSASGKDVKVSDHALSKMKYKYNDMECDETEITKNKADLDMDQAPKATLPSYSKTGNFMFSSASGKDVKVSDDALDKVKSKYADIIECTETGITKNKAETVLDQAPESALLSSSKKGHFMFSSASGKNIKVSDDALDKVKSKYADIIECTETGITKNKPETVMDKDPESALLSSSKKGHFMFSSASGKNVKVSDDALDKVKSKYADIIECTETGITKNKPETVMDQAPESALLSSSKKGHFMFSSASGKNIQVSDAALSKIKSKYNDIMECDETEITKNKAELDMDQAPKAAFPSYSKTGNYMFSSASGKNVKVSDDALDKVKSKYADIIECTETGITKNKPETVMDKDPKTALSCFNKNQNFMFSSTSGKNVKVSDDALAEVKSKYNEILESHETEMIYQKTQTGTNQALKVPSSSLNNNQNFMFSCASGKNIKVSDAALAKVKSKYNDIMENYESEEKVEITETNIGQASKSPSGSDKNFMVSDEALAKVKSKYNDIIKCHDTEGMMDKEVIDPAHKTPLMSSKNKGSFMFSSASGKNIKVSDAALAKVKSKYSDIMENYEAEEKEGKTDTDNDQGSKLPVPNSSKNDNFILPSSSKSSNFMFSSASGKDVKVSDHALAKVKSKYNDIMENYETEEKVDKIETDSGQASKLPVPNSSKNDNFVFSSASGNKVKVSSAALAKVKSIYTDTMEYNETEYKTDICEARSDKIKALTMVLPSSSKAYKTFAATADSNINVSDDPLVNDKSLFNVKSENNMTKIWNNESQLMETSFSCFDKTDPFSTSVEECKNIEISDVVSDDMKSKLSRVLKDNSTGLELNKSINVDDRSLTKNNFATARGKNIHVSEDALFKAKSIFSEEIDRSLVVESDRSNGHIFQRANPPNEIFSDDVWFDPVSEIKTSDEIEDCLPQSPIPIKKTPLNSYNFTKVNLEKKLSISLNQNDKKSKSSHTGNSTTDQPLAKKICFQPGIGNLTPKLSRDIAGRNILKESKIQNLSFTQSISQSILDEEVDMIEKKNCPKKVLNNKSPLKFDKYPESKDLESRKCNDQFISNEESDLTMMYEVSDSAAAFMADCTPERSVISSPSSFFNRKSMKPVKLLDMEFDDVDDEIMVAAELKIIPEPIVENPVTKESTNDSYNNISFRSCSADIISIRDELRKKTDELINHKLKNRPPSSSGLYMTLRNESPCKKMSDHLQPFLNREQLFQLGLKEEILSINANNAETYEFWAKSFFSSEECFSTKGIIEIGYGFSLILSDDNKIGLWEISRCFLSNPNVDPSLVSSAWIKNHYKWIIWKLACYERAFPRHLANKRLTPENVLHQLKYRYDREIDLAQRPAMKKILECDEPSSRRLVACVAEIRKVDLSDDETSYEIELTDGWYSIWASVDPAMKILIDQQKVKIGMKLIIQAAELLNCTEGCDPLEVSSSVRLKLHTNCVRRVKWDSKLGFTRNPGPIRVSLSSVLKNGGLVGLTTAVIARVYPLLYMSKDADGKTILRNAYAEHHASSLKENDLTLKSEELFEKLFPEVEAKYKNGVVKFDKNNIKKIKDPQLLWKIVSNESDPSEVQSLMTPDQLLEVRKYHEQMSSKIREQVQTLVKEKLEELMPSQKAKSLLKVRLVDPGSGCNALMTVWNPSEDLRQILVEKKCFDFYALNATGMRDKVLQLTSTNRTIYKESNRLKPSEEFERKVTTIHDIVVNSGPAQFGEMDVVGTVIFVKEPEKPWGVTNVYLSDSHESFLMITFWTSLKAFGCEDTLKPGSTVACINLQWRQGSGSYVIPSTYANEMTYFSSNPKQEYLMKAFQETKSFINTKGIENFTIERRRRLFIILKEREYNSKTPVSRVETPKVLKRLENLKKYGEASPLPKLSLLSSPDIHRKFRSPKSGGS